MKTLLAIVVAVVVAGCSGETADETRDLALGSSVDSLMPIDDAPDTASTDTPNAPSAPRARPRPAPPTLDEGSVFPAVVVTGFDDRAGDIGDTVLAEVREDVIDHHGRTVIPAGSFLVGTVTALTDPSSDGEPGLQVAFEEVDIEGTVLPIAVSVDSLPFRKDGAGVTAGDAAKVGAGAVVGAVAGRILGGNSRGTAVGAAAGAAAGAGVAVATHEVHVVLDAGAGVVVRLTEAFHR